MENDFKSSPIQLLLTLLGFESKRILKSLPFLIIALLWAIIVFTEIYTRIHGGGHYNTDMYPTTNLLIWLIKDPLPKLGLLVIVFYSGEIIWKERDINFDEIIGSTPVRDITFFMSKFITLLILPFTLILLSIVIGISIQLYDGYKSINLIQYFSMFYFYGLQFVFYSSIAVAMQVILKRKYLAMAISLLLILLFSNSVKSALGLYHPLWQMVQLPEVTFTDMNGAFLTTRIFNIAALYNVGLLLPLIILASKFWKRSSISNPSIRPIKYYPSFQKVVLSICVAIFMGMAGFIYYHSSVKNEYVTQDVQFDRKEAYEKNYKKYETFSIPSITVVKTNVSIFPNKREVFIDAEYTMTNNTSEAIKDLLVTEQVTLSKIDIENARLKRHDEQLGIYIFEFKPALRPGQSVQLSFKLKSESDAYRDSNVAFENGTHIRQGRFEPLLGYVSDKEISNELERKKRGLPMKQKIVHDHYHGHSSATDIQKVSYETTISTSKDQIAIGSGELINAWDENNRRFYHYKSSIKIKRNLSYLSARYVVRNEKYKGINIEIYHHPIHDNNIDYILKSVKTTLDYCLDNFGPYQHDYLRIAEVPDIWGTGGSAMAGLITMTEKGLFLINAKDDQKFDLIARRTAHEVAHMWWGHQLVPKREKGHKVLSESLAMYTEAMVIDRMRGRAMLGKLLDINNNIYLSGRASATKDESPLYLADNEPYIAYSKGQLVFVAIKELIGETQLNSALKNLVLKFGGDIPSATTEDLLTELYAVSGKEHHRLLNDWLKDRIVYDLKIEQIDMTKLAAGTFRVSLIIHSRRFVADEQGKAKPISINEPIYVGAFTDHPGHAEEKQTLYLKEHVINNERTEIELLLSEKPMYIAIDPYGYRIEYNRDDNIQFVGE